MSKAKILSDTQILFLELLSKQTFSKSYYLSGGTALTEFYIPYRLSEDLDFFSEEEVNVDEIIAFIGSIKNAIEYQSFDFNTSFNRNLFFLEFTEDKLKLEFTYYPFLQINPGKIEYGIKIDSIEDIAVNKLFTIYQNPRSRDFMDLYMIIQEYHYTIDELIKKAKIKFDWHVDSLTLGSQFFLVTELKDFPKLIKPLKEFDWQDFFIKQAKLLGEKIIEK
jgi:predicted nucleotidyltransferase component of viral defense system